MNGTLERAGDGWRLRFTRELAHPREKVWRALTEPEHLRAWFPDTIAVSEWKVGAPLRFEHADLDLHFDGEVLACEPPALLEFTWGEDTIRFEVAPAGAGCMLTLLDTIAEQGKAARDGAGWHVCLDRLGHDLDGTRPEWTPAERWRAVHDGYVEGFGPAAATIGPPQGSGVT